MPDTAQEKTERATPHKLRKAREEGQVARSQELNSVIIICLGFFTIYMLGPTLFGQIGNLMRHSFTEAPKLNITPESFHFVFANRMLAFAAIIGPILLVLTIAGYLINTAQVGVLFTTKTLAPKLDKLDIVKGLKRVFSKRTLVEMIRDILKLFIIGWVAYSTVSGWMDKLMSLGDTSVTEFAKTLGQLALILSLKLSAVLFIIALFDFAFQRWDYMQNQKMTRQEVKDEMKDTDGNPLIRSRIRQVQREAARKRMMSEIPKADVVVKNPTHVAVALKYNSDEMDAPMVVAKGARLIAQKIIEIAEQHSVPVIENKPLARSLFKLVDVGQFIPAELYKAVAEVLAHIYRLKDQRRID